LGILCIMAVRTKAVADAALHPVKTLKEHIVALDAAMLVAVTAAEVGAVHKLRTGTRRVEAHMRMLDVLGSGAHPAKIAEHAKQVKAVDRRLRRVRQAAGAVRDLDVQTEVIRYDMPAKTATHKGTPGDAIRKQAKELRKHLQTRRKAEATELIATLKLEEHKLAASLQALEQVLEPASQPVVSPAKVQGRIQAWFIEQATPLLHSKKQNAKGDLRVAIAAMNTRSLHDMRKATKLCRYVAESAPEDAALRQTAERFEAVQEAGGKWHDWLLLVQLSARFHGRKAELSERYRKHRDAALAEYRLKLADLLPLLMS
jgi:CHAD domain-containing protein